MGIEVIEHLLQVAIVDKVSAARAPRVTRYHVTFPRSGSHELQQLHPQRVAPDDVDQKALLATAKQWRMLGEQVQTAEDGNLRAAKSGKPP